MPALPSVPNVLRIDQFFKLQEDLKAKVHSFWKYASGPPTDAELNTMAAALRVSFATNMATLMPAAYDLIQIIITDLTSSTSALGEDTTTVPGTRTGDPTTADTCLLRSRHVARRFRGGHSREYWPFGVANDLNDVQTWGATFVADCETGTENYDADIATAIGAWGTSDGPVSVSFYQGFSVHTGTTGRARNVSLVRSSPVVDPVVSYTIQTGVASQRKRLLRLA
jgi:hypothetical protein